MAVVLTIDWNAAKSLCAAGHAVRREAWSIGRYIQAHFVTEPFPETLPSLYGEEISIFEPTAEDMAATDWRLL